MTKSGIQTLKLDANQVAKFYENMTDNSFFNLPLNSYLVIEYEKNGETKKTPPYLWDGKRFSEVRFKSFSSRHFGEIKPKNEDPYQIAFMDSLSRNQLTFCTGSAGSGKTLLSLAYAFQEYEKGRISKIVVFTNPWIAQSAVKLGFVPGDKIDKLLETSIGSVLISKLGSRTEVDRLIASEDLVIIPMGDCRGYEVPPNSFCFMTEAQNTNRYLMQLLLQRTAEDTKICIEGDIKQIDSDRFKRNANGLERAIEVFIGQDYAGHVHLNNIYRSKIVQKAEEICELPE
ncbi:PhoH family protein [Massilibacteroides sp.]|uniref:PhoH family protein n=1 Tax=Massilibacteroides sp. TaxID=2034766 RepID=UPI00261CA5C7|nr:PhoH family protein [Massilibacteroides sp.]MDD4516344.1 PhoH family protein [Massilibacteroides sp.]